MIRSLLVLSLVLIASAAEAAPRWRRSNNYTYSAPTYSSSMPKVESYTSSSSMPVHSDTSSAQGVAEMMASRGVMQHFGGNSGYEGVEIGRAHV